MGSVRIGDRDFAVTRPADFDAQIEVSTGCTAAEQVAMLKRVATPFAVARALKPMLGEADMMPLSTLADLIAGGDVGAIAAQVAAAMAPAPALMGTSLA